MICSRSRDIIEGEQPTRYFYAQERIKKANSTITELAIPSFDTTDDNSNITLNISPDETNILQTLQAYYQNLYLKQNLDISIQDQFLANITTKLPNNLRRMMDSPLVNKEIFTAIKLGQKGRTPGIDGLPIEFYEAFWETLSLFFPNLLYDVYANGLLL